jgi:CRP-like cAMP-binding protein
MATPVFKSTSKKTSADYTVEFKGGQFIFKEDDLGTEMFIIHEGQIEILKRVGRTDKQLAVLEKGDFFGEMSVLEDLPRTASARALTDVKLLEINGATFAQMLRDNTEIAVRMMRKLSRRLRETDRLLQDALGSSAVFQALDAPPAEEAEEHSMGVERLLHAKSGMEFFLSKGSETTIGRRDPVTGIYPDIDLTPIDTQRSISRRHAKIYRRGAKFFLSEEVGTMNGTFVNGQRLETGVPGEFKSGDELRFGVVDLAFDAG